MAIGRILRSAWPQGKDDIEICAVSCGFAGTGAFELTAAVVACTKFQQPTFRHGRGGAHELPLLTKALLTNIGFGGR